MKNNIAAFNSTEYDDKIKRTLPYYEEEISIKKCYQALRTGGLFITFESFTPFSEFGKHLYLGFITIEILWLSYMQVYPKCF